MVGIVVTTSPICACQNKVLLSGRIGLPSTDKVESFSRHCPVGLVSMNLQLIARRGSSY